MSDKNDYQMQNETPQKWSKESLEKMIKRMIDDELSGFHTDYVLPLENQLKKLGQIPEKKDGKKYSFTPKIIGGKFQDENDHPDLDKMMRYFGNLHMLLYQKGLVSKNDYNNFISAFCGDGLNCDEDKVLLWSGQENLCVYMIDKLIEDFYITDRKKNISIEKIFGIKNVAQKRDAYHQNKNAKPYGKPNGFEIIDKMVSLAYDFKKMEFGDVDIPEQKVDINPKPPKKI